VKDIVLENMVLQANRGMDIQEATGIRFRNITMISKESDPVIDITQSDNLVFDNIKYKDGSQVLFRINGERSANINLKNTDVSKAGKKAIFELGASDKSLISK